jgi:hypothetical protein
MEKASVSAALLDAGQRLLVLVEHEAGHATAPVPLGLPLRGVRFDRHADYGWLGRVEVTRSGSNSEDEHRDRAIVARIGPLVAGEDIDAPSSATDKRLVEEFRPECWPPLLWAFDIEERARRLVRSGAFQHGHTALVVALGRGRDLTGEEVERIVSGCVAVERRGVGLKGTGVWNSPPEAVGSEVRRGCPPAMYSPRVPSTARPPAPSRAPTWSQTLPIESNVCSETW